MDKTYDPHAIEKKHYQRWEQLDFFKPPATGTPYSIMIPPPNVTGSLHMGHGFNNAIMDALLRYHRMKGYSALWQGGPDDAGIATQIVVERQLQAQGKARQALCRDEVLKRVWEWKE